MMIRASILLMTIPSVLSSMNHRSRIQRRVLRLRWILFFLMCGHFQNLVNLSCLVVWRSIDVFSLGQPQLMWPPILGQRSVTWDQVFSLVQPERANLLWDCWGLTKTLDKYTLNEQWTCYNAGERVFNNEGVQMGVKPPLRQVEQYFKSSWRKAGKVCQNSVFLEISRAHIPFQ